MQQKLSLFITISFLLGIIAPACGFMWGGQGSSMIEICTAQGIEMRLVTNDLQPNQDPTNQPSNPMMGDNCDFCFQNANFTGALLNTATLEKIGFQSNKIRFHLYETILLSHTSYNNTARGPPTLV